jgi:hypothetical protein
LYHLLAHDLRTALRQCTTAPVTKTVTNGIRGRAAVEIVLLETRGRSSSGVAYAATQA